MLDSVWGGTAEGWHASNADGTQWLTQNLEHADFFGLGPGLRVIFGTSAELQATGNPSFTYYGTYVFDESSGQGWLSDNDGLTTGTDSIDVQAQNMTFDARNGIMGHALIRDVSSVVPEPATLFVWSGLGLVAACTYFSKKRKTAQGLA